MQQRHHRLTLSKGSAGRHHQLFCGLVGPVECSSFDHFPNRVNQRVHKQITEFQVACEQAPSEVGKKIQLASRSVVTPRANRPLSARPVRPRLHSAISPYTRLSRPKPHREPVRRLNFKTKST